MERAALRVVVDRKQIAADAVVVGLHQPHDCVGCDRRVDGVTAAFEHLHARARCKRLAGSDDAVSCRDFGTTSDHVDTRRSTDRLTIVDWRLPAVDRRLTADRRLQTADCEPHQHERRQGFVQLHEISRYRSTIVVCRLPLL